MTKKHFIALAKALKASMPGPVPTDEAGPVLKLKYRAEYEQWVSDVKQVANVCGDNNPRFDWHTFNAACGL